MQREILDRVRKELGKRPILDGEIAGPIPMFVERYIYQASHLSASGVPAMALIIQFGGSTAHEGVGDDLRTSIMPTQSLLFPPNTPTHWHYAGTVDFAVFYFRETDTPLVQSLRSLVEVSKVPLRFSDALIGAAGRQILDEMQKGAACDTELTELLTRVVCKQLLQLLTTPAVGAINPRHLHYSRLQAVLNYIRGNLTADLSLTHLTKIAGVEESHFRRIFLDATGIAPHHYVMAARLEQARQLLSMSELPIVQIASDCGFSNQSHLTVRFREAHAMTPAQFRKRVAKTG